jgi:hypothetical protein
MKRGWHDVKLLVPAIGGELVAEQLTGRIVVLAHHHGLQFFDLGEHCPLRTPAARTLPHA